MILDEDIVQVGKKLLTLKWFPRLNNISFWCALFGSYYARYLKISKIVVISYKLISLPKAEMVEGQEHANKGNTGHISVDYNCSQNKCIIGLDYFHVWVYAITLAVRVLWTAILTFRKSGQSFLKATVGRTQSTRLGVVKPKIHNDIIQINTGSPKGSNSYGDGGFIVGTRSRLNQKRWTKGSQRNYSTKSSAGNPGTGSNNKLSIIKLENNKFTGLYKQIMQMEMLILSYQNIKSKPGNMTEGIDEITLDGISLKFLKNLSESLKNESFKFKPARRVMIPKVNGKLRPLAIASPRDKIVQEAMRMVLEIIFEPIFLDYSHGFRPGKSCHSALKEVSKWNGITWVIEGDIKGFFDNVDHHILERLLCTQIEDQQFIDLYWKLVRAGYVERGFSFENKIGVPQGSIVSPILSNIYLHEFDKFMHDLINRESTKGKLISKVNPTMAVFSKKLNVLSEKYSKIKDKETLKEIKKVRLERNELPSRIRVGIRIYYVRYADDWLIGILGNKEKAMCIRDKVAIFLEKELKILMNKEKTKITHLRSDKAKFLGVLIFISNPKQSKMVSKYHHLKGTIIKSRISNTRIIFFAPYYNLLDKLRDKGFLKPNTGNKLIMSAITKWIFLDHKMILLRYNAVIKGFLNYYSFVDNLYIFHKIVGYILRHSCAKTLARKFNLGSRAGAFKKFGKNLSIEIKEKTKIRKIGLSIPTSFKKSRQFTVKTGIYADPFLAMNYRLETVSSLGENCAICGETNNIEMHHVKHLRKDNIKSSGFLNIMSKLNRKQLPLCVTCHRKVHAGLYNGISLNDLWIKRNNDDERGNIKEI